MNLIFWDGRVNAAGSDRPVYSFGKTEVKKEEDWFKARIKEEKKPKSKPAVSSPELTKTIRVEDLTTLSDYLN